MLVAALLAIWFPAINHLRHEWTLNEQYRYGFVVPLLAAYLFSLRWVDRPVVSGPWRSWFVRGLAGLLLVGMSPLVLAEGANPDWRMLSWTLTVIASALTLIAIGSVGGRYWAWHFAFPVLFVLVAVPWPMRLESSVIQLLMRTNAAIAVEMVNLLGVPAQQAGNLINLGTSTVGVDEACSGVRSLQTTIMAALLLGELFRFPVMRRVGLLVASLAVALFWNLLRTLTLVGITANWSATVMESWHDRVGLAVLACSLGSVFGLSKIAQWMDMPSSGSTQGHRREAEELVLPPKHWCWMAIIWVALVVGGVELWYRTGAVKQQGFAWSVHWPTEFAGQREIPIPHQTWRLMKFTYGVNRAWEDEAARRWSAYYLEWAPGCAAQVLAQVHRPDICLPATGKTLTADRGIQLFTVRGMTFPFRHYVFEDGGTPLQVYFSLQQAGTDAGQGGQSLAPYRGLELANRIAAIRERRRDQGQQQLELAVWGISDEAESAAALQRTLENLVVERR